MFNFFRTKKNNTEEKVSTLPPPYDEGSTGESDYQSALLYQTEGNLDLMKYHLLKAIKCNHSPATYLLACQYKNENNANLYIEYLKKGHYLRNKKCSDELIKYYLNNKNKLSDAEFKNVCTYISENKKESIDDYVEPLIKHLSLFFVFSDYDKFYNPYKCIKHIIPNHNSKIFSILMNRYMDMNRYKKEYNDNQYNFTFYKKEILTGIKWELSNSGDINFLEKIKDFAKTYLEDDDLFMECYKVIGQLKMKN